MNVWWSQTMVQAVGWTLLHFLWQGLVIAALLAIGLRLLRRGRALHRYLAGCAALLLMTLAPLVTFQLVLKQDEPAPVPVIEPMAVVDSAPVERTASRVSALPKIVVTATPEARAPKISWRLESFLPWLVGAWLLGVGGLSCRLFAGWLQIRRLRRADAETLADGWPDKLAELARRLGVNRPLRLLRTACVEVPTVIGWLRPVILLPAACLTGLTTAQLESIIAHELAHIRRHDYLINLLQSAVETLLFYHPAVWWVSRRIREERENCCDDLVVEVCGDRVGYARALATLEELRPAAAQLALAAGGAPLLQRIRRVLGQGERSAGRPAWPLAGMLVVLLLAATAAGLRGHRAAAANNGPTGTAAGKTATNSGAMMHSSSTNLGDPGEAEKQFDPGQFTLQWTFPGGSTGFTSDLPLLHSLFFGGQSVSIGESLASGEPVGNWFMADEANRLVPVRVAIARDEAASRDAPASPGRQSASENNQVQINTLVQDGKFYFEASKYSEADARFKQALKLDPNNVTASQYIALIQGKRDNNTLHNNEAASANAIYQVDDEWKAEQFARLATSQSNSFNLNSLVYTSKSRQAIFDKLNRLRIDKVNYANLPLKDVLDDLMKITRDRSPDGKGINFFFDREAPQGTNTARAIDPNTGLPVGGLQPGETDVSQARVNISLNDVRLMDVLDAIIKTSDTPVRYSVLDYAIVFSLRGEGPLFEIRTFRMDPNTFIQGLESVTGTKLGGGSTGMSGGIGGGSGGSIVAGVSVAPGGGAGFGGGSAGGVGGLDGGGLVNIAAGGPTSAIQAAILQYFTTAGVDLRTNTHKVVIYNERKNTLTVRATSQDLDTIEAAIQTLNQPKPWNISGTSRGFYDDKTNTPPPGVQNGTNSAEIKPTTNGQATNAGVDQDFVAHFGAAETAAVDSAIKTLNSTASQTNQSAAMEIRAFHVDRNVFRKGLESARAFKLTPEGGRIVEPGTANTNKTAPVEEQLRELFRKAGVALDNDSNAAVLWNENRGTLIVRATPRDLDLVATVIASLNQAPPEVNIKARFVEITQDDQGPLGFQWSLGGFKVGNATNQPGTNGPGIGGVTAFPGNINSVTVYSVPAKGMGSQTNAPRLATVTGILTDPQFRAVLQALDQRDGVDILTTPEVTTESGRPAQMQSVDIQSIVELNTNTNTWRGTNFTVKQMPFGPTLDVTPYVSSDEFSIRMTLIPSVTEFLGYDDPGQFVPTMLVTNGSKVTTVTSVLPLPHFRLRQAVADVTVWDGQTVVIGGFGLVEDVKATKDKVPVLGSLPLVGQLFRSEHVTKTKKSLMVFVTATIINPDGTRYHKDEEMPFAKSSFPPQAGTNAPSKK